MKPLHKSFVFLLVISILPLNSCEDDPDCSTVLPPPNWFDLGFFSAEGEPLIGTEYLQEEFRVFNQAGEQFIRPMLFGDSTRLQVRFEAFESDTDYYIEVTPEDIDTLNFSYEIRQRPCFRTYELVSFRYNGQNVPLDPASIRVDIVK